MISGRDGDTHSFIFVQDDVFLGGRSGVRPATSRCMKIHMRYMTILGLVFLSFATP
jgi:hypothetical protein